MDPEPRKVFLEARDLLFNHRTDYAAACRGFKWPELTRFNWALDYFDPVAAGNERPALWVVDANGSETRLSFARLSERSARVANFLRAVGVQRGDRILDMLGNEAARGTLCSPPSSWERCSSPPPPS
jgi:acetyl-CoA synthetase